MSAVSKSVQSRKLLWSVSGKYYEIRYKAKREELAGRVL